MPREAAGIRLDRYLAQALHGPSRSEIQRWIEDGAVTVDGKVAQSTDKVRAGSRVEVQPRGPQTTDLVPDPSIAFEVLYVDSDLVVLVKPAGLVVHPGAGHATGTLVHGLLARGWFDPAELDSHVRPGVVHRLDKGTSGVMVVARTPAAREALKEQFFVHSIERAYDAITVGIAESRTHRTLHGRDPRERMRFTSRVRSGKTAITRVELIQPLAGASLVRCTLETGRTHQIRVHLAESGTPVLGDPLYGKPPRTEALREVARELGHQALHARVLGFIHPSTKRPMRFEAEPPPDFGAALSSLSGGLDSDA